jgi:class 3 adenylate cyclase
LTIRVGLHTGRIEVHDDDDDISGLAVNLAARIEHAAAPGAVFASSTVRDLLLGGDRGFVDRGGSN